MVDEIVVISQSAIGIRRLVFQMGRWSQTVLGHLYPLLISLPFPFLPFLPLASLFLFPPRFTCTLFFPPPIMVVCSRIQHEIRAFSVQHSNIAETVYIVDKQ